MKPRGLFCRISSPSAAGPSRSLSSAALIPRSDPQPPEAPLYSTILFSSAMGRSLRRLVRRKSLMRGKVPSSRRALARAATAATFLDQPQGRFRAAPLQNVKFATVLAVVVLEERLD